MGAAAVVCRNRQRRAQAQARRTRGNGHRKHADDGNGKDPQHLGTIPVARACANFRRHGFTVKVCALVFWGGGLPPGFHTVTLYAADGTCVVSTLSVICVEDTTVAGTT